MDRTTKFLLAAIGLFANAAATVVRPAVAQAILRRQIAYDMADAVILIANGRCDNVKLCPSP
jgi:hypothetical protein